MNYNNSTKDAVKALNNKQTVIIETVTTTDEKGKAKTVKNVYAGNFKRRQDAYYIGMEGMKAVRKGETTKEYRLLKLGKLIAEVSKKGYNTKTNYFIAENYSEEPVKYAKPETAEEPAAEVAETEATVALAE